MPAPTESAILRPMPRHERPEIPEGYAPGRATRRAILRALLDADGPRGQLRLAAATGEPETTVRRHARRLVREGLISQTGRGYALTTPGREAAFLLKDCGEG